MINSHTTRVLLTMGLVCPASTTASAQASSKPPLPRAPAARVVTITPPGRMGSEPAIALNPYSPNQVVAAAGAWAAYSTDSGRTFTPVQPAGEGGHGGGDVSLTFDDKGSVFLSF